MDRIITRRRTIAGLSFIGIADALYMLAYTEGLIDRLVCPFFGEGCEIVGRSDYAKSFAGVPNSAVGALGYAGMATLAVWSGNHPPGTVPLRALALGGAAVAAGAASAYLTWAMKSKVRAWCFWCLGSAALNAAILPLALAEARDALRGSTTDRKELPP
jgi:uncharacterized membrane protein